jgi:hypothetical protein
MQHHYKARPFLHQNDLQNDHPAWLAMDGRHDYGCIMHPFFPPLASVGRHVHVSLSNQAIADLHGVVAALTLQVLPALLHLLLIRRSRPFH